MLKRIAIVLLLAACAPERSRSVVEPYPAWAKGCIVLGMAGVFLLTWVGIALMLDSAATRHIFHFRFVSECGRCVDELREKKRNNELAQAARKAAANG